MLSKGNGRNNNHEQSLLGSRFKEVVPSLGPRVSLSRCGCEMAERESNSGVSEEYDGEVLPSLYRIYVSGLSLLSFIHFSPNASFIILSEFPAEAIMAQ